jgi:hypothetical protein
MKTMHFALIALLLSSKSGFAADVNTDLKKMQLALDKNNPEAVEEIYDNNEKLAGNWMANERLALSFERRNKFKEAIATYRLLIINFNQEAHKKIVATQPPLNENLYTTNKLPYYYYKLAFLNAQLFVSSNTYMPAKDRISYKKNAEGYLGLLRKVKGDEGDIKLVQEQIEEKIKIEDQRSFRPNWYAFIDIISWQDQLYLKNTATSQKTKLLSTAIGSGLGLGKKWSNSKYEFNLEGMYSFGTSTISSQDANVNYQQSSVPVYSLIAGPGMYYKGFSEKVLVGIQIPFSYRKGDWVLPEGTYQFENDTQFGAGYLLQVKFYIGKITIRSRLGKIFPNPASHWSIGGIYDF